MNPLCRSFAANLAFAAATFASPSPPLSAVPIPRIVGAWVHVYQPNGDVFPGPDSPRFKAGRHYPDWQVNDHAILKGPDGRWHAFGITHPAVAAGETGGPESPTLLALHGGFHLKLAAVVFLP